MFRCRMCSENPFAALFGQPEQKEREREMDAERKRASRKPAPKKPQSRRNEADFRQRTDEELRATVRQWEQYAHPRAREFFSSPETLTEVLMQLARGTDRGEDCILGSDDKCVYWYGEVTKEDMQAVIRMVKPQEPAESVTYVNRVLAFIFATDESFEKLMQLPKQPFKMSCNDQLCVHLGHISVAT